jgi:glycosyltransferase involved in cell wall biosynthesis
VLDGYTRLNAPPGGWKLFLVDNGSSDDTKSVIESFTHRLPLSYLYEPRRGQNWARLRALEHLEGDLVVFSDDDTTPDPDWLLVHRGLADARADYDIFTGAIKPQWETTPPSWILDYVDLGVCYTATDPATPEGPVAPNLVWSPNMSHRRRIFELGYRFDPSVGPSGTNYAMGSETDFNVRLGEAGFKAWFSPRAIVHHFVRSGQFDRDWILGRAVRFGRGMHRRQLLRQMQVPPLIFGVPRYLVRKIGVQWARYLLALPRGSRERFLARWELNYLRGCALQAREHYATEQRGKAASIHGAET